MGLPVKFEDIKKANERLKGYVRHTPLIRGDKLDSLLNCEVYLKPESLQLTGSFKIRGATNKILTLTQEERARGIIASSSGNHAQGVAYAAHILGIKAILILPQNAPVTKIKGTKALGAEVILHGFDAIQRYKKLYELVEERGYSLVHSYNDPILIAGQGTVGYEIIEDLKEVDTIVVPLGGGGILSGVALAVKEINPKVRIIGVEPYSIPRYTESRKVGKPVEVPTRDTIADGLMITIPGNNTLPIIEKYVDEIITVEDRHIQRALNEIIFKAKLVVEPSAAIGIGAAISGNIKFKKDEKVCFVLTGGNIDPERLIKFIQ